MNDRGCSIQDLTRLGPDRLVIVAKDQEPATVAAIYESFESTIRTGVATDVRHLVRSGWFVRMDDYSVTFEDLSSGEFESYPLEQVVMCVGMDVLKGWLAGLDQK
jgi:hypothetical protein